MSAGSTISEERRRALQQFAFTQQQDAQKMNPQHSLDLATPPPATSGLTAGPPAQSRDATSSSRYFTSTKSSNATVLVPNSSPLAQGTSYQPYRPYQYQASAMPIPNILQQNSWFVPSRNQRVDPLSRPSGFVTSTDVNNASNTRPNLPPFRKGIEDVDGSDDERPRKRANVRGSSPDPQDSNAPQSPLSPEISRFGQKRKLPSNAALEASSPPSSDDFPSPLQLLAGPSKPRIVRGHRPQLDPDADPQFKKLVMAMPLFSPEDVKVAYLHCNGDIRTTTALLIDPNFNAGSLRAAHLTPSTSVSSTPQTPRLIGKVKEIEEEREAARAAAREKAAKSAIYRKRADLDIQSPPLSTTPSSTSVVELDQSPIQPRPSRLRMSKRKVFDSGSEPETDEEGPSAIGPDEDVFEKKALESLNTFGLDALRELTGCTPEQADTIISLRPFVSVEDVERRLQQGKKKAGPAGISPRMFRDCVSILEGFGTVDKILLDCERIGRDLKRFIAGWSGKGKGKEVGDTKTSRASSIDDDSTDDGALHLVSISDASGADGFISKAPSLLADSVQLKDYQIIGVNWLNLLHGKGLSCILADEMGLGKTVQVISFFALLKERGIRGPHLIVVPSSTLENWCREFERFAPSISIQTYYAGKEDRPQLRETLLETRVGKNSRSGSNWEVLITTYNLAVGDEKDRKFLRKIDWATCVFDEGHILKNFQSQRYVATMRISSQWKLLLTGTPLQNNLQELVSLLNFILPEQFANELDSLRTIFKVKGDSKVSLLAEQRVSRAKRMMTPFVLRRRKDQVLKDLPAKTERIEWCDMLPLQKSIYRDTMQRSRKTVYDLAEMENKEAVTGEPQNGVMENGKTTAQKKKGRLPRAKDKMYLENSSNVLMDLRKAASHPMLFRTLFTDSILTSITRVLLKEPDFKRRGAIFEYVKEDMEVMTDSELQAFCKMYKSTQKFALEEDCYLQAGKIETMMVLLNRYMGEGRKCLIFSQFTQILDILQVVLRQNSIKYLVLTGSTAVDVRQGLVDEFTEDESIPVFLLSTKAGGMGINLTAASVVILFDQDFNPHNDRQAADRAYRIGQKRDVEIVKLISRGTIEEDMLKLGETKLALDEAVAGDAEGDAEEGTGEGKTEKIMKSGLMNALRQQFEEEDKKVPTDEPPYSKVPEPSNAKSKSPKRNRKKKKEVADSDSELSALTDLDA